MRAHPAGVILVPVAAADPRRADGDDQIRAGALAVLVAGLAGDGVRAVAVIVAANAVGGRLGLQALLTLRLGRLRGGAAEHDLLDYFRRWNGDGGYECSGCHVIPLFVYSVCYNLLYSKRYRLSRGRTAQFWLVGHSAFLAYGLVKTSNVLTGTGRHTVMAVGPPADGREGGI